MNIPHSRSSNSSPISDRASEHVAVEPIDLLVLSDKALSDANVPFGE